MKKFVCIENELMFGFEKGRIYPVKIFSVSGRTFAKVYDEYDACTYSYSLYYEVFVNLFESLSKNRYNKLNKIVGRI